MRANDKWIDILKKINEEGKLKTFSCLPKLLEQLKEHKINKITFDLDDMINIKLCKDYDKLLEKGKFKTFNGV